MLNETHTAVVARNEAWEGSAASEPYEAGWAKEALVWWRILAVEGPNAPLTARVQLSPDGMRWADEGSRITIPATAEALGFARVREFGSFLRLAADLPRGVKVKTIVTIALKA
jgi:hypothetical protein